MNVKLYAFGGRLWSLVLLAFMACEPMPTGSDDVYVPDTSAGLPESAFSAPEGLVVVRDFLVVANTNYGYAGRSIAFGQGFITVIDRVTRQVVNRIPMPAKNPQIVATGPGPDGASPDSYVWVLCSGETTFDGQNLVPASDGALVGIATERLETAENPDVEISIKKSAEYPLVGYPSSLTVFGDSAWMGSGTTSAVFMADLKAGLLERGPANPIVLGDLDVQDTMVLAAGSLHGLFVGSFNRDRVFVVDTQTQKSLEDLSFEVGNPGSMDGILSIVSSPNTPDTILILLGLSNLVAEVDLGSGAPEIDNRHAVTGSLPNGLLADAGRILVVNSGDNNVTAFDQVSGDGSGFLATCPTSSNPYAMAVASVGQRRELYVTCLMSSAVMIFDADTGESLGQVN